MNARDLRIGNIVFDKSRSEHDFEKIGNGIYRVSTHAIERFDAGFMDLKPVPLTSEWLERFGFTRQLVGWAKDISLFPNRELKCIIVHLNQGIMLRSGDLDADRNDDDIVAVTNTDIQGPIFVHQLQNFFHSITGSELQLKD